MIKKVDLRGLCLDLFSIYAITLASLFSLNAGNFELLDVTILQMWKLRLREGACLAQEHPPGEWWSQELEFNLQIPGWCFIYFTSGF